MTTGKDLAKSKGTGGVSFKDSIKTKLIAVMIIAAAVPLLVALIVSYVSSTNKAIADAQDSLEWQAWYIESEFAGILDKNMSALQVLATSPATKMYLAGGGDESLASDMLAQLKSVDDIFQDGNVTIITGKDGQQLLRTDGGTLVNAAGSTDYETAIKGTLYISDVQTSKSSGALMITMVVPVYDFDGSTIVGLVQRNYDLNDFHDFLAAEADDAFIADRNGIIAAHSQFTQTAEDEPKDVSGDVFYTSGDDKGFYETTNHETGTTNLLAFVKEPKTGFVVAIGEPKAETLSAAKRSAYIVCIIGVILLICAAALSLFIARSFTDPIIDINKSLSDLSDGRFTRVKRFANRKDEFGQMVGNTNSVIETLDGIVSRIKDSASSVGESSEELSDTANQISQTAEDVSNAVQEIASGATQQADEIQNASENVRRIGDAVIGVQSSTSDLEGFAGQMKEASEVSSKSLKSLQDSSSEMTQKIDEISTTIQRTQNAVTNISEKVEGITSIATQTNLLSLNASIEAARAGETGRGFSVVAEEIGKLAEDSKNMADDIKKEMEVLLEEAKMAVTAAEDVKQGNLDQQTSLGETIESINGMLGNIDATVGGVQVISDGAEQCDSSKNAVVDVMSTLSAISEENAASSEETGASMQELSATVTTLAGSANNLKHIADQLNKEMEFFKG